MDVASCLQCFESSLSSYTGDDPLDPWDKFVDYMEQSLPADGGSSMSMVFEKIVQTFLSVERYADDIRYVNHCIKCARYYSDPVALYSYIFSNGVGTRTAALYVAWARQLEQLGTNEQADAIYQKAMENRAQPADDVLSEYRLFQMRTRSQTSSSGRNPLQNSNLTNQMSEPVTHSKVSVDCPLKPPAIRTVITVSRSETSGTIPSGQSSGVRTEPEYLTDELVCDGSELCFEEVRAEKYFRKLKEKQEADEMEKEVREDEEELRNLQSILEKLNQELEACRVVTSQPPSQMPPAMETAASINPNPTQQPLGRPPPSHRLSSRRSLGLRLHAAPTFIYEAAAAAAATPPPQHRYAAADTAASVHSSFSTHTSSNLPESALDESEEQQNLHTPASSNTGVFCWEDGGGAENRPAPDAVCPPDPEENLNTSQGATANLSHLTPNNSLGFVQATPSRVLPSPTVNTREALDVIMDMFQAPTLLEEPFGASVLHTAEKEAPHGYTRNGGVSFSNKPLTTTPFTVFQDDGDKENGTAAAPSAVQKSKPIRALAEIPAATKPNDTPLDLMPDESTMWGARYNSLNSLAACPNSTTDFAMLAEFVSTPFTHKTPSNSNFFQNKENSADADDGLFTRRPPNKLSPIMEQSPSNEKLSETAVTKLLPPSEQHGTIVSEGLCLTTSSVTMAQPPPPAVLSFRDQTLCPSESSAPRTTGPYWDPYTSPEKILMMSEQPEPSPKPNSEPFTIMEDVDEPASAEPVKQVCSVPMSPDCALSPDWLTIRSPEIPVEPDLDAFLSPCRFRKGDAVPNKVLDVPMSPEQPQLFSDVPMSPEPSASTDEAMESPERTPSNDMSMNATPARTTTVPLRSDPWDDQLICDLLSALSPPLTAHPRCITWQCNVPNIGPKMTISMGKASLRVDCVLGQGAFATVYQATDPVTSDRMVLKVQKPANPWEFYINTQLDARLPPDVRHLYSSLYSAHLFRNGSVLLGELHNYGTLLNAVNIYKGLSDKVMPQPLVIFFTVCILNMVEQLHSVRLIHADIKPDNFLLGERFLDNKCFDSDGLDHGLVLVDLGQSIDMDLFPEGTAFTARCLTSGFQCTEMLSGKPWSYQTDYFGIAGTIHCMLFGTYMQVTNVGGVWKTNGVFRRNPHGELWQEFFHALLNVPDRVSLRSLRSKLASVLSRDYGSKLSSLKNRLVVLLLESRKNARR